MIKDIINSLLTGTSTMDKKELDITIKEATQCLLCALYGVSTNVQHEIKPINGLVGLIQALNDPYVRKGLGLLIELEGAWAGASMPLRRLRALAMENPHAP